MVEVGEERRLMVGGSGARGAGCYYSELVNCARAYSDADERWVCLGLVRW